MAFTVRRAHESDVDQIAAWTTDTFAWGDYVGGALGEWIEREDVHVLVVEGDDGVPMAVARTQMLSPTEGWLDAARVHPEARRQGLGSMLNDAGIDWVRERGGIVARLAIEDDNAAAKSQVAKLGYRLASTWATADQEVDSGHRVGRAERLQTVGKSDVDPAWMFWSTSELAEAGRGLMPFGWLWRRATVDDLVAAAAEQRLLESPAGWVVINPKDNGEIDVVWAATSANEFPRLIDGIMDLAVSHSATAVLYRLPQTGWSGEALVRAGAKVKETHIFTRAL